MYKLFHGREGGHPLPHMPPIGALRLVTSAYNTFTPSYVPVYVSYFIYYNIVLAICFIKV